MYVHTGAGPMTNRAYVCISEKITQWLGLNWENPLGCRCGSSQHREDSRVLTYLVIEVCLTVGQHREGPPDLGDPRVEEGWQVDVGNTMVGGDRLLLLRGRGRCDATHTQHDYAVHISHAWISCPQRGQPSNVPHPISPLQYARNTYL